MMDAEQSEVGHNADEIRRWNGLRNWCRQFRTECPVTSLVEDKRDYLGCRFTATLDRVAVLLSVIGLVGYAGRARTVRPCELAGLLCASSMKNILHIHISRGVCSDRQP